MSRGVVSRLTTYNSQLTTNNSRLTDSVMRVARIRARLADVERAGHVAMPLPATRVRTRVEVGAVHRNRKVVGEDLIRRIRPTILDEFLSAFGRRQQETVHPVDVRRHLKRNLCSTL